MTDAERAIRINGQVGAFVALRGEIHESMRRNDAAASDFRLALRLDPQLGAAAEGLQRLGLR
ncbi:MAG: tetratricopeptide repeat protein, partial [Beijerinckiaceae bacterium]